MENEIVLIDDYILIYKRELFGIYPLNNTKCYYLCLLGKAWAKINGSYVDIIGEKVIQAF